MAISSIGVGSNLDLGALLDNLRKGEEAKLSPLQNLQKKSSARITGYGQLKSEVTNYKAAADLLMTSGFSSMKTTVSGTDFTATSTGGINASYSVNVTALAKSQSLVMQGIASRSENIGDGGVIHFSIDGKHHAVDLAGNGSSLNEIVEQINKAGGLGVQATILNTGERETPYRLMISSKTSGTRAAVTDISVSGNQALDALMNFGGLESTVKENAAANAQLHVNGVDVTSQTNHVADVIDGVTLNLTGASGMPGRLDVLNDNDAVKAAIQKFVDAHNGVNKKIKQLTSSDSHGKTGATMAGESAPRFIQSRLAGVLSVSSTEGNLASLPQIGITTDPKTGLLTVNASVLDKLLNDSPQAVKRLFTSDVGVARRAVDVSKDILGDKGSLDSATKGAEKTGQALNKDMDLALKRLNVNMERMRRQFLNLDKVMAGLNNAGSYLRQQLSALS